MRVAIKFHNAGPHTIWGQLAAKLGREPTDAEAAEAVRAILSSLSLHKQEARA